MKIKKVLAGFLILIFLYLGFTIFFYVDFAKTLDNYYDNMQNNLNAVQSVIFSVYSQNSILYQALLIDNVEALDKFENNNNININITDPVLNYLVSSEYNKNMNKSLGSNLKDYFALGILRKEIIDLHRLNLISTQRNYKDKLSDLLNKYNILVKETVENFSSNVIQIKQNNFVFKEKLKKDLILKLLFLFSIYIFSLVIVFFIFISKKLQEPRMKKKDISLLDQGMRNILSYVEKEISRGYFPTIKDVKKQVNLTHPTIISKLKVLSLEGYIEIKKSGRNKHIILK